MQPHPSPNPYTAPKSELVERHPRSDATDSDGISQSEFAAFGGNDAYPMAFKRYNDRVAKHAGFNVWAAMFGTQWFVYRKLYFAALGALFVDIAVPMLILTAAAAFAVPKGFPWLIFVGGLVLLSRVGLGFLANWLLFRRAVKVIQEVDGMNLDNARHLNQIKVAGGVSGAALFFMYLTISLFKLLTM